MNMFSRLTLVALAVTSLAACDFLDQESESDLSQDVIFVNGQGVEAAINGAYQRTQVPMDDYVIFSELAAEFAQHTGSFPSWSEIDANNIPTNNVEVSQQYTQWYALINQANQIIDNVGTTPIEGLLESRATQIVGEAYFFRAFALHNLTKWFGAVPLILSSEVDIANADVERSSVDAVYDQILSDLDNAASRVAAARSVGLVDADVVRALRARVLLYDGQYDAAATAAAPLAAAYPLVSLVDLYGSLNSAESIWELQYTNTDSNSMAFFAYVVGGRFEYGPTPQAQDAYAAADGRREYVFDVDGTTTVIGKYFRVASGDDHHFIFRGAEMVLIQAEAAARSGDTDEAVRLVNLIRARGGAEAIDDDDNINSSDAALNLVLAERARELSYEGHRWHDLVRTGRAVSTLSLPTANFTVWPIPQREIDTNELITQNPGY